MDGNGRSVKALFGRGRVKKLRPLPSNPSGILSVAPGLRQQSGEISPSVEPRSNQSALSPQPLSTVCLATAAAALALGVYPNLSPAQPPQCHTHNIVCIKMCSGYIENTTDQLTSGRDLCETNVLCVADNNRAVVRLAPLACGHDAHNDLQ